MFSLIICSLLFIKTNQINYRTGINTYEDGEQDLMIDVRGSPKNVKSACLMSKTNDKDEADRLDIKNIEEYAGIVISDEDLINHEFYTIYLDMKCVDKKHNKTYFFNLVLDDNESFITRSFYYSEKEQKWVLGHSELNVGN